jgi:hypothetical protein
MTHLLQEVLPLIIWSGLWGMGGVWISRKAFNLRPNEQILVGLAVGLVLQNWLANLLGQVLPLPSAFWIAAGLVLICGLAFSLPFSRRTLPDLLNVPCRPLQWAGLFLLSYLFFSAGRGLAILDDYQNLPLASLIATGDIPPHFPLDPSRTYGYHYFTLLFAAQLMRIGSLHIWTAMDLARGFSFALALVLMGMWVRRITGSILAGYLGGLTAAFSSGVRWLLLLLPQNLLARISADIHLIGSGAASGVDLSAALLSPWASFEGGIYPFPFVHVNGFNPAGVMSFHSGAGSLAGLISAVFFLTHTRFRDWRAAAVTAVLLSALALANEVAFIATVIGLLIAACIYLIFLWVREKKIRIPKSLGRWLIIIIPAGWMAAIQGGVLSGIFLGWITPLFPGSGSSPAYHTFHFSFFWPPAILSTHLGQLTLTRPLQLFVALLEIGPVILVLPLVIFWGIKAIRYGRWYEAGFIVFGLASASTMLVEYSGTAGVTALTRVQGLLPATCTLFAVPALWLWGRRRSETLKIWIGVLFLSAILSGVVLFGIQLIAAPKPVFSNFLNDLDAKAQQDYWNRLEEGVLVFDPLPYRSPVVFGRPTKSSAANQYQESQAWQALKDHPSPQSLWAFGFSYAYLDQQYWDSLPVEIQVQLQDSCMILLKEYIQVFPKDFRRLYDLKGCQ